MNNLAFGQYYNSDSILHRLDPRTKLLSLILMMVSIFVIDQETYGFIYLGILFTLVVILVLLSKVPLRMYLKSLKSIVFILVFSFVFQLIFNTSGEQLEFLPEIPLRFNYLNITLAVAILVIYLLVKKYLPVKFLFLIGVLSLMVYILTLNFGIEPFGTFTIKIYEDGVITGFFIIARVFILIMFSSLLTLTTKPTDINNGLEAILKPFELLGLKTSILAMMVSIALRYIPTLFNETQKILKAQASRGVDFNEGKFKDKVVQIVSLLVPMFVISFKRAAELADAMEARGYIPGGKRTKINEMKLRFKDYFSLFISIAILVVIILGRVL